MTVYQMVAPYIIEGASKGAGADYVTAVIEIPAAATGFTVSALLSVAGSMIIEQDMSATGAPADDDHSDLTGVAFVPHTASWKTFDSSVLNAASTTDRHFGMNIGKIRITVSSVGAGTLGIKVSVTGNNY